MQNKFTNEQIEFLQNDLTKFVKKISNEIIDKADWISKNYDMYISLTCLRSILIDIPSIVFPLHQEHVRKEKRLEDLMRFFQEMECRINENLKKLKEANNEN